MSGVIDLCGEFSFDDFAFGTPSALHTVIRICVPEMVHRADYHP